jgi:hypothetical protein
MRESITPPGMSQDNYVRQEVAARQRVVLTANAPVEPGGTSMTTTSLFWSASSRSSWLRPTCRLSMP